MGANPDPTTDLNATIASAVNARIEAEVMKALAGDEVLAQFVSAALQQKVEVKNNGTYRTEQVPFLTVVLRKAIQDATAAAVTRVIADELPTIEDEVRKALRRDLRNIAEGLAHSLKDAADKAYGVKVDLTLRMPGRD